MNETLIEPQEWEAFKSMADPATLVELLNSYLEDAPQLIQQMRDGLAAGDVETVRRAAHSLKSNSASFGANRLAGAARELEMIAKGGTLEGAASKLAGIEAEYTPLAARLVELKNGL
jgi:HPt (histidine-containing phosphotransfer) domain-containing protein